MRATRRRHREVSYPFEYFDTSRLTFLINIYMHVCTLCSKCVGKRRRRKSLKVIFEGRKKRKIKEERQGKDKVLKSYLLQRLNK